MNQAIGGHHPRQSTSMEDYAARHPNSSQPGTAPPTQNPNAAFLNPEWHAAAALMKGPVPQSHEHFDFPQRNSHQAHPPHPSTSSAPHHPQHPNNPSSSAPHQHLVQVPRTAAPADDAAAAAAATASGGGTTGELIETPKGEQELRAIESRRKESHKEVEKRRRENINQGINRLLTLLPPVPFPPPGSPTPQPAGPNGQYSASVPPTGTVTNASKSANKAVILESAANYIQHLKDVESSNIDKWTVSTQHRSLDQQKMTVS